MNCMYFPVDNDSFTFKKLAIRNKELVITQFNIWKKRTSLSILASRASTTRPVSKLLYAPVATHIQCGMSIWRAWFTWPSRAHFGTPMITDSSKLSFAPRKSRPLASNLVWGCSMRKIATVTLTGISCVELFRLLLKMRLIKWEPPGAALRSRLWETSTGHRR